MLKLLTTCSCAALLLSGATLLAASSPAQTQPPDARPGAASPLVRADPNGPANAGRRALSESLNETAARYTAARRAAVITINTRAAAIARQAKVRAKVLSLLGPLPEKTPLNAQVLGSTQGDGFRIEKVLFESQPGFRVTALFYIPDGKADTKLPAILMAPGHGATAKRVTTPRPLRSRATVSRCSRTTPRSGRAPAVSRSRAPRRVSRHAAYRRAW